MRYAKSCILFAVVLVSITLILSQLALAKPPLKPGNPGLPGCLSEVAAKEAEIAELQEQITAKDAEIEELNELVASLQNKAFVPQTGQTICYDVDGYTIDCEGTGQDGEYRSGVDLPAPRFTSNGDGTVTDNLTGLMWQQDTDCIAASYPDFDNDDIAGDGRVTWQHALDFVAGINNETYSNCGAGYTDWKLPNIRELQSLVHYGFHGPALSDTIGTGHWSDGDPFFNDAAATFWSSTTHNGTSSAAWRLGMGGGNVQGGQKSGVHKVWCVRSGN
jgi:hypothetical protein